MHSYRQGGGKLQRKFGRHIVKGDGRLFSSRGWFNLATGNWWPLLKAKCGRGICKVNGGPSLDRKPVKFDASALDQEGALDEIDDHIRLRPSSQFDFFVEEPDRFLKCSWVIGIETRKTLWFPGPGCRNEREEEDRSGEKNVHQRSLVTSSFLRGCSTDSGVF
jgi:hypothetical protein